MVVLEVVCSEDEIVVKCAEEETHNSHNSTEAPVTEDRDLNQRWACGPGLQVVLPEAEADNDENGYNNKSRNPCSLPANNIALSKSEHEG